MFNIPSLPPKTTAVNFLQYLSGLYNFLISVVAIFALVMIVYGGLRYLTSVGNPASVEEAKDIINSAIIGLVLALSSWLILNEINPDILVLKKPGQIGALPGKYAYNQIDRACVAGTNPEGVQVQNDPTKKKCKCVDDPTRDVTFTPSAPPTGPYVVSTSITPCAKSVPTSTKSVTITFSEAMDASTVSSSTINTHFPGISTGTISISLTSPEIVTISWPGTLAINTPQEVDVTTGVKSATGIPMAGLYDLRFTTEASFTSTCTPPTPIVVDCLGACSNPLTPGLNPPGYHCAIADLKAGTSPNSMNIDDTVNIKAGDTVYFDAKTYSRNFAAPNFNVDVSPSTDSKFHNGVDSYIIRSQLLAGANPKWDPNEKLWGLQYDYFWTTTTPPSGCSWWASFATSLISGIASIFGGSNSEGMIASKYNTVGEYKAILNTYVVDGNGVCQGPFIDRVYVNVK